jgi:hypothetical protein
MPDFTTAEARMLAECVARFAKSFSADVGDVLAAQFRGCRPFEVSELIGQLSILERQLEVKKKPVTVHEAHSALLKRVLIEERRRVAEEIDMPLQKAIDGQIIRQLRRAIALLHLLQERIARAPYRGMYRTPSVSIGLCVIDADCFLTDREIQGRANVAKNYAKATEKGRIATFDGIRFRDADLGLVG